VAGKPILIEHQNISRSPREYRRGGGARWARADDDRVVEPAHGSRTDDADTGREEPFPPLIRSR